MKPRITELVLKSIPYLYHIGTCIGLGQSKKKISFPHSYIVLSEPDRTSLYQTIPYQTGLYHTIRVQYRCFWTVWSPEQFFKAEPYWFLAGTVQYIPNQAVQDGFKNPG